MTFNSYLSPFSWRYSSEEMRQVWSEVNKRKLWRQIWVALAEVQSDFELVTIEQVAELRENAERIDVERSMQIESEIHHDLMAELKAFAEQCPNAGGVLHMGATSMDIEDNTDVLRLRTSLDILLTKLRDLLLLFSERIITWAEVPVMAFTHIQPAEPSTLGYRLSIYAQDLYDDWHMLKAARTSLRGKGFKGAVGTGAAYADLIGLSAFERFEERLSQLLDLPFYPVTTQTYPRKQDYRVISDLAGLGSSIYKFAFDLRLLQSPVIGELAEPFGEKQVGSSAMPFKRNPIHSEKIDSLARMLAVMPQVAWQNAANSLLERTLDDSANRRSMLPEAFLICDELLITAQRIIAGLDVREKIMQRNLETYAPFAVTERLMMAVAKKGADRQDFHEHFRRLAVEAWREVNLGRTNPLIEMLKADERLLTWLMPEEIDALLEAKTHIGIAPKRAVRLAEQIRASLNQNQ